MTNLHHISQFAGVARPPSSLWTVTSNFRPGPADARQQRLHDLLDEIVSLAQRGAHRQIASRIHDFVTEALRAGDIGLVDALVRMSDVSLGAQALTSLLVVTRPVADKLAARKALRDLAQKALIAEVGEAEAAETLRHL